MRLGFYFLPVLTSLLFTAPVFAFSTFGLACPDRFIGEVVSITEPEGVMMAKNKTQINFKKRRVIAGDAAVSASIKILKHINLNVAKGKTYLVEMKDGLLCNLKEVVED